MKKESLYKSIQSDIQEKILDGTYPSGHQLMPENQMADHYSVSRITIRNAMDNLVNARLVERIRGKGTFVVDKKDRTDIHLGTDLQLKEKKISLIVPNLNDLHTIKIFNGLYGEAEKKGFAVTVYQTRQDQKLEEQAISRSLRSEANGLCIYPIQKEMYNEEIIKLALSRFPAVLIDRSLEGINVNSVVTDNETASYDATRYLLSKGHKNIGFISPNLDLAIPLRERYRGFVRAHEEAGVEMINGKFDPYGDVISRMGMESTIEEYDNTDFERFIKESKEISAFLCAEPLDTKLLMKTLKKMKKAVPDDISLVGFDDFDNAELFSPPPTVVRQDSEGMGRIALSILARLISGEEEERKSIRIDADLIVRESVRDIS